MKCRLMTTPDFLFWIAMVVFPGAMAQCADLATAPAEQLLQVYAELRSLSMGNQWAPTENVTWKRDAATFVFHDGRLSFAAPVEGRVLAAVFEGRGTFVLSPPTELDRHQIARFAKGPKLEDGFRSAIFFFTDQSWAELQQLVKVQSGGGQASGKALESAQKKYSENLNEWWENQSKGNPPMRNLAARMLADLTDPSSRGFFLADFKGDPHGDLLFQISWNRDPLFFPGFSNDEEVMLLHWNRGNYYEWWSGFHTAEEYAKSPHPEHRQLVAHCSKERIDAQVSKSNHLSAAAEMDFTVPGGPARVLQLSLDGVLRISSITDEAGKKLSFIQEDRKLDSDPWIILAEPAAPDRAYTIKIAYEEDSTRDSRIIHQEGTGLYYVGARESWYPSFGAFDDRTRFHLRFRSPKRYKFIATGRRVSAEKAKDSIESEWESEIPYSVVGFNYGDFVDKTQSDPNLAVTAYAGREVPDELKGVQAAMDIGDLARGPQGLGRNTEAETGILTGGFNTAANAAHAAGISYQAFKLFDFYFGPLPFKSIAVTEQPVRGFGQSWPTLIFLPYDSLLDATTRNSLRLQEEAESREFYNVVAVHEMAHQWWGHMIGWKTYHDVWLSEGFAEFSAALYLKKFQPEKFKAFWDLKRKWLLNKNSAGHRPVDVGPLWLNYQTDAYLEPGNTRVLIYMKGAYVLEMLRTLMEDPKANNPDARFIVMMRDFINTFAGKNPSTEDFRRVVEKHIGEPMGWFFDEWVYGTEVPRYDFSYQLRDGANNQSILTVSLSQSEVSDNFAMRVPIYVQVGGQSRRLGLIAMRGSSTFSREIPLPFRPEKVTLDDSHSILCSAHQ